MKKEKLRAQIAELEQQLDDAAEQARLIAKSRNESQLARELRYIMAGLIPEEVLRRNLQIGGISESVDGWGSHTVAVEFTFIKPDEAFSVAINRLARREA